MRQQLRLAATATAVLFVVSCGPQAQDQATLLRGVPSDLTAPTTTSTTTTTVLPAPTTTAVPSEGVLLHLVTEDAIRPVLRNMPVNPSPQQVLDALIAGLPAGTLSFPIRSALPPNLDATVTVERGLAIVDTDESLLTDISPLDQRLAIGQIVLTLTSRPGIGQVSFRVAGEPRAVPRAGGDLAPPDEPVAYDDYSALLSPGIITADGQ